MGDRVCTSRARGEGLRSNIGLRRAQKTTANIPYPPLRFFPNEERLWQRKMSLPYDRSSIRTDGFAHRRNVQSGRFPSRWSVSKC